MRQKLFFWLKIHLGFSAKESKGFLLLIPFLVLLVGASQVLAWAKDQNAEKLYLHYLNQVDSLERAGVQLLISPLPTFNPEDTLRRSHSNKVSDRAGRIIKHREHLGGFIHVDQLNEVYGLKPETLPLIWEYFDFDTVAPRQLDLNSLAVEELAKHPYISYQEAKVLVAYRLQHGPFHQVEDILRIKIFKAEWVAKIGPYLSFNPVEKKATIDSLGLK